MNKQIDWFALTIRLILTVFVAALLVSIWTSLFTAPVIFSFTFMLIASVFVTIMMLLSVVNLWFR